MTVRVLLVDDVADIRRLVRTTLRLRGGFDVVGEASDGRSAIEAAAASRPDVIVLDLGLPDLPGGEVVSAIRELVPEAKIVIFTGTDVDTNSSLLQGRVEGFVPKNADLDFLVDLLADVVRNTERSAELQLGLDMLSARRARKFVAHHCMEWGCDEVIDSALVVVSELVTNAVTHAQSSCELRLSFTNAALRVEVVDTGGGNPDLMATTAEDEHGRGLFLISALTAAWGVEATPSGKAVWAQLPVPGAAGGDKQPPLPLPSVGNGR